MGLSSSLGSHQKVSPFVHASLVKFVPYIQCCISRIIHYVKLFHQTKSTYSGDRIERFSLAQDSPLHLVLDLVVFQEPDIVTQASAGLFPVLEAGIVSVQSLLESGVC